MSNFKDLNLQSQILSALDKKGYTTPTPIQEQAIPHILDKRDLLGIAQTGTGKTAAFALPILQILSEGEAAKPNQVKCLILTPTRELASQIAENIENYGTELSLKYAVIFGGTSEKQQIKKLETGLDIVIATPGRLLDLMSQGYVRFSQLEILVLDEADRMLDMGFITDVKKIITKMPKERQTLFFSATMPSIISLLAKTILNNPVKIEITPAATTVERIDQKIYFVERSNKTKLLKHVLEQDAANSILVFFRTKQGADRLNDFLERNEIKVETIHGDKSQSVRESALANFRDGKARVLIATDIAARGIDIPGITHVVNFDIPSDPESYVHRIGRTARAGKEGIAISFCDPTETLALKSIESTINYKIPVDITHPFHGAYGVSGVRKLASGKKPGNLNSNQTNKMTTEPKKMHTGRKISSAKDAPKKIVESTPVVAATQETSAPVVSTASENSTPVNSTETSEPRAERAPRNNNNRNRNNNRRSNENRRPTNAKKPHHPRQKKQKTFVEKLVDKVKSILGIKKPVKKRSPNKNRNSNRNRNQNRNPNRNPNRTNNNSRNNAS